MTTTPPLVGVFLVSWDFIGVLILAWILSSIVDQGVCCSVIALIRPFSTSSKSSVFKSGSSSFRRFRMVVSSSDKLELFNNGRTDAEIPG